MKNNNEDKINKAFTAGIWYTVSAILLRSISIVTTPIFTRLLSTSDYGIVTAFTSWYSLLLPICSLNLTYSIPKAKQDFEGELKQYITSMSILSVVFTAVISMFALLNIDYTTKILGFEPVIVGMLIAYLISMEIIQLFQTECRFLYKFKENVLISIIITVGSVLASLFFIIVYQSKKYYGRILGIIIPVILIAIFIIFRSCICKNFPKKISKMFSYWKYGMWISVPLIFHVVSLGILTQSDRVLIATMRGNAEAGIYGLSYQYGILISVITNAISEAWQPWFFDIYRENEIEKINMNIPQITELGCIVCLGCIAISPEAIWILGGNAYKSGVWVVTPVALSILCQYVYSHYVNVEMYYKKNIYISIGTAVAAITNIILNYVFIPQYGFVAAGYTTFVSYIILMVLHCFIVIKVMKKNIYKNVYLFSAIIFTAVMALIFTLLFNMIILRYGLLCIILVIYIIRNRKILKDIIRKKF